MEQSFIFVYVHSNESECNGKNADISEEALEAKWRVIDYILRKIILKTD